MKALLVTILAFMVCGLGLAQPAPALVNVEVRFLANESVSGLFIQPEPAPAGRPAPKVELNVGTHGRGESIRYRGPANLTLFSVSTDDKGLEVRTAVTSVALPIDKPELLIVLLVGGGGGSPRQYRSYAFDDSFAAAPSGSVRFLNLTPIQIYGRLGNETVRIAGGVSLSDVISRAADRRISLAYQLDGQTLPIIDQAYTVDSQERLLIVLLPPFSRGSGLIRARVIADSPLPILVPKQTTAP